MNLGGKIVYIEGGKSHRVHSGSKGGAANNMGPIMDMAMLSESVVRGKCISVRRQWQLGCPRTIVVYERLWEHIPCKRERMQVLDAAGNLEISPHFCGSNRARADSAPWASMSFWGFAVEQEGKYKDFICFERLMITRA